MNPDPPAPESRYTTGPLRWRASVGRHRGGGRILIGRWVAGLATALVVVAAGGAVANSELSADERFREFVVAGEVGEWVSGTSFAASVRAVRTAAVISAEPGLNLDTAGVWVVVRVQAMAEQESGWLGYAVVRGSDGRSWSYTERFDQPLINNGYRLDPRIPVEAEIAFEVPRDAATDLTLRLGERPGIFGLQMATLVGVPLPVDDAMVTGGLANPEPVVIEPFPEVVIADPQVLQGTGEGGDG